MNTKRATGQKWWLTMQDAITNCPVTKCDGHKSREYGLAIYFYSNLCLEKRSRK